MENASKALLMAGGILLGLIILAGLVLMWTNISKFQANNNAEKEDQIAQFNQEFVTYTNEKNILGVDIISLINKVESYNDNNPDFFNSKVQYEPIKIFVTNGNKDFDGTLTPNKTYQVTGGTTSATDPLKKFIKQHADPEADYGRETLSKWSANVDRIKEKMDEDASVHNNIAETIKTLFGRDLRPRRK